MSDLWPYLLIGAAGAYLFVRQSKKNRVLKRKFEAEAKRKYMKLKNPVVPLSANLNSKAVGAKDAKLLWRERGPCGSVKHIYELPNGSRTFSYLPLDTHTAH